MAHFYPIGLYGTRGPAVFFVHDDFGNAVALTDDQSDAALDFAISAAVAR